MGKLVVFDSFTWDSFPPTFEVMRNGWRWLSWKIGWKVKGLPTQERSRNYSNGFVAVYDESDLSWVWEDELASAIKAFLCFLIYTYMKDFGSTKRMWNYGKHDGMKSGTTVPCYMCKYNISIHPLSVRASINQPGFHSSCRYFCCHCNLSGSGFFHDFWSTAICDITDGGKNLFILSTFAVPVCNTWGTTWVGLVFSSAGMTWAWGVSCWVRLDPSFLKFGRYANIWNHVAGRVADLDEKSHHVVDMFMCFPFFSHHCFTGFISSFLVVSCFGPLAIGSPQHRSRGGESSNGGRKSHGWSTINGSRFLVVEFWLFQKSPLQTHIEGYTVSMMIFQKEKGISLFPFFSQVPS